MSETLPETLSLWHGPVVLLFDIMLADYAQEDLIQSRLADGVVLEPELFLVRFQHREQCPDAARAGVSIICGLNDVGAVTC